MNGVARFATGVCLTACLVFGALPGLPASAALEGGSTDCGSVRYVSIRSRTQGFTVHTYSNGHQLSWRFTTGSWTVKYSTSGMHRGGWQASGFSLDTAGTYGLCLT